MRLTPGAEPDWKKVGWAAARTLSDLIRIDTSNPPGNETGACECLAPLYRSLGLDTEIFEPEPGRGSVVGRLRSDAPAEEGLILLSHLDVVPADPGDWTFPPFSGAIEDGLVWGRGAIDCKHAAAAEWHALKLFVESGRRLRRDIVLAATADEEAGGQKGVLSILEQRPELLAGGYAINEGGGFGFTSGEIEIYFCQTAEKGVCWIDLVAEGEPGHASVPRPDSAMDRMIGALADLAELESRTMVCKTVRDLADGVVRAMGGDARAASMSDGEVADLLRAVIKPRELRNIVRAMTMNTVSATVIRGGSKVNVIPGRVEASLDCRVVPGYDPKDMLDEIRAVVAPRGVWAEPRVMTPGAETEPAGEFHDSLKASLKKVRPSAEVVPFMLPGGADGRFLMDRGVKVLGFIPCRAEPGGDISMLRRAHGVNERVAVQDLAFAVQVLYNLLVDFCAEN